MEKLTTVILIDKRLEFLTPEITTAVEKLTNSLISQSHRLLFSESDLHFFPEIKYASKTNISACLHELKAKNSLLFRTIIGGDFVAIEFSLTLKKSVLSKWRNKSHELNQGFTHAEIESFIPQLIVSWFLDEIYMLCAIGNISIPGSISILHSKSWLNKTAIPISLDELHSHIDIFTENKTINKINNPIYDIKNSWDWFKENQDVLESGSSPLSRAFVAYTKFLKCQDSHLSLLWLTLGIEAIYNTIPQGGPSIRNQLKTKIEYLFKQQGSLSKSLMQMYDFRSKFLHGKTELPFYEDTTDEKLDNELLNALSVGMSVLVATLQFTIKNKWNDLVFYQNISVGNGQ